MLLNFVWIYFLFSTVNAEGNFIVLHSPNSIKFNGNQEVDQSLLKEIFSAALGFTAKRGNWSGMSIQDSFNLAEAVVSIAVEGVDSLNSARGKLFPLNVDESEETTWQALCGRLEERDVNNTLVRFYLGDGLDALGQSALGELKPIPIDPSTLRSLNLKYDEDKKFLDEVQLLRAIAKEINTSTFTKDSKPDVYWFVVSGLRPIIESHGKESPSFNEALTLLNDAINDVKQSFVNVYNEKVLITTFTAGGSHDRRTRSINLSRMYRDTSEKDAPTILNINRGKKYNDNYPVIFNIILWFGVTFFFSLLAICIAIASMDPGRDSIIYRMTSNRMKKEN